MSKDNVLLGRSYATQYLTGLVSLLFVEPHATEGQVLISSAVEVILRHARFYPTAGIAKSRTPRQRRRCVRGVALPGD